jgi:2-keto-3-deoxy-L-rhamnonate aldolase RhmA
MEGVSTLINPALERMRAGDVALGLIVRLVRTAEIAVIAGTTGHDFLFIDLQHGPASLETVADISLVALGRGVAPLVRVRGCDDPDIGRILDSGALGIVVPDVASAAEAERAVAAARFPPAGRRSAGAAFAALGFRAMGMQAAASILNETTLVACMIETPEGLDNLEEIAGVPGIDVLHLGCNDLLARLGLPGQFDAPSLTDAKAYLLDVCRRTGKFAGFGGDKNSGRQADAVRSGFRFVTTQSDLACLMSAAGQRTAELRKPDNRD